MMLLTVSSGMGPVEVRRFVRWLADVIEREVARRGALVEHVIVHGFALAPSSIDLALRCEQAVVADLLGTHELVLKSDSRGKRSRKRWYAGVSCAVQSEAGAAALDARDVSFETCRAGGAGGQHVNRTESAVRAVHRPSGLSVRIETERSQQQNKRRALEVLASMLSAKSEARAADASSQRRHRSLQVERGRPVGTWRLQDGTLVRIQNT